MAGNLEITVNGVRRRVEATPDTPLLYVLRNELRLNGPKFGCGLLEGAVAVAQQHRQAGGVARVHDREI